MLRENAHGELDMMIKTIKRVVSEYYDIDLDAKCRQPRYALPRNVTIYLCRVKTDKSYNQIKQQLNYRDHTTMLYAMNKMREAMQGTFWDDKRIQEDVKQIKLRLEEL